MISRPSNVAIIGGGLSGPTLALCLKKQHGISSTIYELRPEDDDRGVNIALAPNALRVMQHIGVYDELRAQGFSYEEMTMTSARSGQELGYFFNGSEKHYNFAALRIHRRKVQLTLLREARAQGIKIHFNKKLINIQDETNDHVKLQFADGETVETEFVIAADGIHSRVRDHITQPELPYSGFMGIITMAMKKATLDTSIETFRLPTFCFGQSGMIAVFPSNYPGNEYDMFSTMPFPARSREEWQELAADKDKQQKIMLERFGQGWPDFISRVYKEHSPEKLELHPFFEVPRLESWTSPHGRVILIGDAAHAFSPQGGQGAAMAFEDAETLAYTMSRIDFASNRSRLLREWEQHRKPRVQQVKDFTDGNGRMRSPTNSYIKQTVKEWIMWGTLKYTGPVMGMEWLYGYNAEDIKKVLNHCL